MFNVLSKPKKLKSIAYIRIASREYVISPESIARKIKASRTMSKYNYQSYSKAHSLIKEKIIGRNEHKLNLSTNLLVAADNSLVIGSYCGCSG